MKLNLNWPEQTALICGDRRYNYQELDEISDRIAAALIRKGIKKGDRVAIALTNSPEIVFCYYACFKNGAIAVPINTRLKAAEIKYILNHCQPKICISQADIFPEIKPIEQQIPSIQSYFLVDDPEAFAGVRQFRELIESDADKIELPRVDPKDAATILYTSGTTGRPKGVIHTHRSLELTAAYHAEQVNLTRADICGVVSPLYCLGGSALQMIPALSVGATLVIIPRSDPAVVLQNLQQHRVTHFAGMPVLFNALVNHPNAGAYNLDALRICIGGGDVISIALQQRFAKLFGVEITDGCGMSEVVPYTLNPQAKNRVGSIGKAALGMKLRLVDDRLRDVDRGQVGEILVRSDGMMKGYWHDREATAAAFSDGWLRTGDLAWMDEEDYYWFVGRKKDIIIRGGSNISPLEVEEVLYQHPAVREAAVIGLPDPTWGESIRAFVALRAGHSATKTELREFVSARIAAYKVPETIVLLRELPKGSTGKIHRQSLRDRCV